MNSEARTCQNCKKDFVIKPEDFAFYEKIKAPAPTFCPTCRLQRRLVWFRDSKLYKRKCDLCQQEGISMYRPDSPYVVYCHECWWSDRWDSLDYGRDYDFTRPFFEQFNELLHKVPLRGLAIDKTSSQLSPYTNHVGSSKNCYLIFFSDHCENTSYGFYLVKNKEVYDSSMTWECEQCYGLTNGFKCYKVIEGRGNIISCVDSYFLKDCRNCQNCFGAVNLRDKSYVFFGEQLTREEYQKRVKEIDLGSYKVFQEMKVKAEDLWKRAVPRPVYDDFSQDSTGNYVFESKNCKECYDSAYSQDCKYLMLIKEGLVKDCYDYIDWGDNAERLYECATVGQEAANVNFSQDCNSVHHVDYSKGCMNGSYLFGCVNLKNQDYCILNKKYKKEQFEELKKKIVEQMTIVPFVDPSGNRYQFGEFFPPNFAPHEYNDTFAQMFFPLSRDEALRRGFSWSEPDVKEYEVTMQASELPDHIKDVKEDILKEVIKCEKCTRGFRVIDHELRFLRHHNLPLPRQCPFCRIEDKIKRWVWQMTLTNRICDKCGKSFRTNYREGDAQKVYCKECYWNEVR